MDKATLSHEVASSVLLLEEELRSFAVNAEAAIYRKAIHSLYYAAFNATCALLWSKGIRAESHDGVQSLLSLHFVKPGALPRDTLAKMNELMARRHAADYKGAVTVGAEDVAGSIPWVLGFVGAALALVRKGGLKVDLSRAEKALDRAGRVHL